MDNTLQSNPSDPTEDFFQPDWNSAAGEGVEVPDDKKAPSDFSEIYQAQRDGAAERVEANPPQTMAGDNTEDEGEGEEEGQ